MDKPTRMGIAQAGQVIKPHEPKFHVALLLIKLLIKLLIRVLVGLLIKTKKEHPTRHMQCKKT